MDFPLRAHTHLLVVAGSRGQGLHRPGSDVDVKGVAIPPARYFHGCTAVFEQAAERADIAVFRDTLRPDERAIAEATHLEGTVFDLRKLLRLAAESNPNLLEILFCRDEEVRLITPLGRRLREARALFVTARARHTFGSYATAQLKRIETHRRWLLTPPTDEPVRAAFGLPERTVIPADQLAAANAAILARVQAWDVDLGMLPEPERVALQAKLAEMLAELSLSADTRWQAGARALGMDENFLLLLDRERRYKAARTEWEQHRHWRATRNAARAEGEARHGYDTKHGAHLWRLLEMCKEILLTGQVHVWRGDRDADTLRAIREGAWPYEELVARAKERDAELTRIVTERRYVVPDQPDMEAIDRLCVELVETSLRGDP